MSKIKPVRYAAAVKLYLCASGFGTPPAARVRALPGNSNATVKRRFPSGHTTFSPPRLLNHWSLDANGIKGKLFNRAAAQYNGYAHHGSGLLVYHTPIKQAA